MSVLLTSVSSDEESWNLAFLELSLEEAGHEVVNLGSCVGDDLLLAAARDERPDAIVLSSVNPRGHLDGARVIRRLRAHALTAGTPVVIGGKLDDGQSAALLEAGFDAVFGKDADLFALTDHLAAIWAQEGAPA